MSTLTREPQEGIRRHKLLTAEIRRKLPKIGATERETDPMVHLKLFSPVGRMTLYCVEFDGEDTLYGYMVSPLGPDCDEWGYSSFTELAEARVMGIPAVERDCYWSPKAVKDIPEIGGT